MYAIEDYDSYQSSSRIGYEGDYYRFILYINDKFVIIKYLLEQKRYSASHVGFYNEDLSLDFETFEKFSTTNKKEIYNYFNKVLVLYNIKNKSLKNNIEERNIINKFKKWLNYLSTVQLIKNIL